MLGQKIPFPARGRVVRNYFTRVSFNKKKRRHSGRVTPYSTIKAKRDYLIQNCLEPQEFWDDWQDHRDGMRAWMMDRSKLHSNISCETENCEVCGQQYRDRKKHKRLLKIRKAKKRGRSSVWI